MNSSSVLILCSGGIDSTALIHYYKNQGLNVSGLHFQYQQLNDISESEAIEKISNYYSVSIKIARFCFPMKVKNHEYFCRNALFVLAATSFLPENFYRIAIGIHSGTPYYDCTKSFIIDCQRMLDGYFGGTIYIEAPFLNLAKNQIYDYCYQQNIPLDLTYSCENQNYDECGVCPSCLDRRRYFGESK